MLFTIGTSNRGLPEFLAELEKRGITGLIDVRSSPYSRVPWFNAGQIEKWSERAGIHYRLEGDVLGGRTTLTLDDPAYHEALDRVLAGACREPTAIFCAEGDPTQCHRTWEVAGSLLIRDGVVARSILRDGREEDVTNTLSRCDLACLPDQVRGWVATNPQTHAQRNLL